LRAIFLDWMARACSGYLDESSEMVVAQGQDLSLTIRCCQYVEDLSISSSPVVLEVGAAAEELYLSVHY